MKRVHPLLRPPQQISGRGEGSVNSAPPAVDSTGKGKAWQDTVTGQNVDAGMDELLEVLGYKVRSSDMAEVAHRLEQLEEVIGNTQDQDGLTNIVSDTVHYNPSDLFSWLESMLSELNPPPNFGPLPAAPVLDDPYFAPADSSPITSLDCSTVHHQQSQIFEDSSSEYDLKAIPGRAIYSSSSQAQAQAQTPTQNDQTSPRETKRLKQSHVPSSSPTSPSMWGSVPAAAASTRPLVLLDSQENGIRLVQALTACAEALQQEDLKLAELLMKQIEFLAASQAGAMGKVAVYFANAIAHRIYRRSPQNDVADLLSDNLQMHFYDTCPYLKFAHFTANQAILDAFAGKKHVHVIDFSMNQGLQWPMLMQALAVRSEGPPTFRLTGIGPPSADGTDRLQDVGWKLARLAEEFGLKFRYRGFVAASLADLDASTLDLKPGEAVAVNSVFELHRLLAWPGAIEKVLSAVRDMKPEIVTVVEQEASHNGPVFQERFMQALHFYSSMFDSLEGAAVPPGSSPSLGGSDDMLLSEMYLGKQICNVVACEGTDRVERHETLGQWRGRFDSAGFAPVHIGSDAYKQASMLLAMFAGGNGYRVDENGGCLLLGWHLRPLIAASAWQLASRGGGPKQVMRPS